MSNTVLARIRDALPQPSILGFVVGEGKYLNSDGESGKIVFTGEDKPKHFLGGAFVPVETFKVVVRGKAYNDLVEKVNMIKNALKGAGFIQIGGYEDIGQYDDAALQGDDGLLQLAVNFRHIKN